MSASAFAITNPLNRQTGPRTNAGKEASSNNATRHGGTAAKLIVPGEDPADFQALLNGLLDEYRPDTTQSRTFVENVATAHWFLARRQRAHNAIEAAVYQDQPDEPNWTEQHLKKLALADRYRTQAERSLKRALQNLEGWCKWTRGEANRERRRTQWQAEQEIRERRMTLQEQKFALAQARQAAQTLRFAKNAVSSPQGPGSSKPPSCSSNQFSVPETSLVAPQPAKSVFRG